MMRCDAAANDRVPMTMVANFGILFDKAAHEIAARLAAHITFCTTTERGLRSGFVTAPPRRQEDDRRQQVVRPKRYEHRRRPHFGHAEFQLITLVASELIFTQ